MRQLAIVKTKVKEPQVSDWEEKKTVLEREGLLWRYELQYYVWIERETGNPKGLWNTVLGGDLFFDFVHKVCVKPRINIS